MSATPENLPSHHDTMRARIRQILLDVPSARSNDKILIITYWRRHGGPLVYDEATKKLVLRDKEGISYEAFLKVPSTESICRIKRFLQRDAKLAIEHGFATQQDAELLPSERVAEQRAILEGVNRQYFWRG